MSGYNLPDGCRQAQLDAALGYEPEIELTEEEEYAEYVEKVLATAHLAPPNVFYECGESAPRRTQLFTSRVLSAAERVKIHELVDTLTLEDLDWVEEIAAAAGHRLMRAELERDERQLARRPAARANHVSKTGRAA